MSTSPGTSLLQSAMTANTSKQQSLSILMRNILLVQGRLYFQLVRMEHQLNVVCWVHSIVEFVELLNYQSEF